MPRKKNNNILAVMPHHPDHSAEIHRLRRMAGQLEAIGAMISDRRYCPEIIQQIRAVHSAMKALEIAILKKHFQTCIRNSARSHSKKMFEKKLQELLKLIRN